MCANDVQLAAYKGCEWEYDIEFNMIMKMIMNSKLHLIGLNLHEPTTTCRYKGESKLIELNKTLQYREPTRTWRAAQKNLRI